MSENFSHQWSNSTHKKLKFSTQPDPTRGSTESMDNSGTHHSLATESVAKQQNGSGPLRNECSENMSPYCIIICSSPILALFCGAYCFSSAHSYGRHKKSNLVYSFITTCLALNATSRPRGQRVKLRQLIKFRPEICQRMGVRLKLLRQWHIVSAIGLSSM